jgi:hypothetical protein
MDARLQPRPPGSRTGKRGRRGLPSLFALVGVVFVVVYVGLTPWALHIGGRSTPLGRWDGFGEVQASNGGRYMIFTHLEGGVMGGKGNVGRHGGLGGSDNLHGTAELCTESGMTETFTLAGNVHGWWTTDGARTGVRLTGGAPTPLPSGWDVALHGSWRGPALELSSPDNSFTEVFTPRGTIRHVTSTADAGTARVTLQYGSHEDFAAACRVLQHGAGAPAGSP